MVSQEYIYVTSYLIGMRQLLQRLFPFFIVTISLIILFASPHMVSAATKNWDGSILNTLKIFGANMGLPDTDPRIIVARLIRTAMGFVGIVMLLMILSSGASFMFSGGDEEKIKHAKKTFYNAIIGLIIMLSAYSIVAFLLRSLSAASN